MAPKYRLVYFDIRGYAEKIRLLFAYKNIEYEDVRLAYGGEEWAKLKPEQPFGKVPVLEFDGEVLAESRAIARYIARENGLAGKNNLEAAKCDMLVSAFHDFYVKLWDWILENDPTKKEEFQKILLEKETPAFFHSLMKILQNSNHLVGDSLTWADIAIANGLFEFKNYFPEVLKEEQYKSLNDLVDRIHNLPGIKEWVAKRPLTQF